jgi:glycosyltransferase involved in cell wall biosynthesis
VAVAYVEPNDPIALAAQMVALFKDPARRARLVRQARAEYEPLRWETMKQRYLKVVEGLSGQVPLHAQTATANHTDAAV